jgi:putative aldouronate transport system permease protein
MYGIQLAFKDFRPSKGIWGSDWVGLKHFIRFVTYPDFWKIFSNSLIISLYSLATFPCSIILALSINELESQSFKRSVQMITYMPHFISIVIVCGMIMLFFNRSSGMINNFIHMLGGQRIDFMTNPKYFRTIYVWSGVWKGIGWGSIIYLSALSGVSPELVEAARIDGATRLQIIWHINIPAIIPTIVILFILSTGGILSVDFTKIFLLQNDLNKEVSSVISTYVYEIGLVSQQYSYSTAIGLFNTAISVALLLFVNKIANKVSGITIW